MESIGQRDKTLKTLFGEVRIKRSMFVCPWCGKSRCPGDEHLGRIFGEATRRGLNRDQQPIVLTDGAAYNRSITETHFPKAIHIIDLHHAREHLHELVNLLGYEDHKKAPAFDCKEQMRHAEECSGPLETLMPLLLPDVVNIPADSRTFGMMLLLCLLKTHFYPVHQFDVDVCVIWVSVR